MRHLIPACQIPHLHVPINCVASFFPVARSHLQPAATVRQACPAPPLPRASPSERLHPPCVPALPSPQAPKPLPCYSQRRPFLLHLHAPPERRQLPVRAPRTFCAPALAPARSSPYSAAPLLQAAARNRRRTTRNRSRTAWNRTDPYLHLPPRNSISTMHPRGKLGMKSNPLVVLFHLHRSLRSPMP
jgi:hypothetical protein